MDFTGVSFRKTFRDYQKRVLDNAPRYLDDRRIHIVAAPGSGKTILGLELIRMLDAPALILAPTVTIRAQWGERFAECFLPDGAALSDYISYDLDAPALMTCVTYQALHMSGDTDTLAARLKEAGVRTLCLDEAHHLRREWQKTLETLVRRLRPDMTLIALTATPPYDAEPQEWARYRKLCGEIDEEIFVPELVAADVLCPHQDYVFFNLPDAEEAALLEDHRRHALACLRYCGETALFERALEASGVSDDPAAHEALLWRNWKDFAALVLCASVTAEHLPDALLQLVRKREKATVPDFLRAQRAFSFVIARPDIFTEDVSEAFRQSLTSYGLLHRGAVCFDEDPAVTKRLVSSSAKLDSIAKVTQAEYLQTGDSLRLLILTDHIKKEAVPLIGTDEPLRELGAVTTFEAVRRVLPVDAPCAVLTGGVVIVKENMTGALASLAASRDILCGFYALDASAQAAGCVEMRFAGEDNKDKVSLLTEAFEAGVIRVLVGTRALLGEGWDAPCMNALILASYIGSFVSSNQMRGRAIRRDERTPDKTANIWHLVTLDADSASDGGAPDNATHLSGKDYEQLCRRFDCFMGPAYDRDVIESGISRLGLDKLYYTHCDESQKINNLNHDMLARAADRDAMRGQWRRALFHGESRTLPETTETVRVETSVQPVFYTKEYRKKAGGAALAAAGMTAICAGGVAATHATGSILPAALTLAYASCLFVCFRALNRFLKRVRAFRDPSETVAYLAGSVLNALRETGDIRSPGAHVRVFYSKADGRVLCSLLQAGAYEKNLFAKAMEEMLSPVTDARYVIVRQKRPAKNQTARALAGGGHTDNYDFAFSYACPSVLGSARHRVDCLLKHLNRTGETFEAIYTQTASGAEILAACGKYSWLNTADALPLRRKEWFADEPETLYITQ